MSKPILKTTVSPLRPGAEEVRVNALALTQPQREQQDNGERPTLGEPYPTSFTKGLPHDVNGIVKHGTFETFFAAIKQQDTDFDVPLGPQSGKFFTKPAESDAASIGMTEWEVRGWESPLAGHAFDLQGPDADSVAMAPAPRLGSDELAAEMAEVYAMAILRDTSFEDIRQGKGVTDKVVGALAAMPWFDPKKTPVDYQGGEISGYSKARRDRTVKQGWPDKPERNLTKMPLDSHNLFRGSTPGELEGPYISQFLLQGSRAGVVVPTADGGFRNAEPKDGYIVYGPQRIDQRVRVQEAGVDYMQHWDEWLDVQNGAQTSGIQAFEEKDTPLRFIHSPRDLASYVHVDALYQAYLNACLLLLSANAKGDRGLPEPNDRDGPPETRTRTPFALFGGPHILTLVTECATRALKAVRRQKYNVHCRARPEALGGVATLVEADRGEVLGDAGSAAAQEHLARLKTAKYIFQKIKEMNYRPPRRTLENNTAGNPELPDVSKANLLLPMAFPEGSPMHPAYGAGHATVAGTCTTILKAFFEMYADGKPTELLAMKDVGNKKAGKGPLADVFVAGGNGLELQLYTGPSKDTLTLAGELNKLAANISIGRNMAGVHYYSDYYDSIRMGERIAIGILEEQMGTYGEPISMTLPSFDDEVLELAADGRGSTTLSVNGKSGAASRERWYARHAPAEQTEQTLAETRIAGDTSKI
ncbi:MAG: bromoperoxidase [Pseudomonadota bacterium]